MRAHLVWPIVVAATLCSGCATARQLRAHADRGAPIVPEHVSRQLEPAAGYMLVNPLACFVGAGGGCSGEAGVVCLALMVACTGVVTAVDVVALPVQAVRRRDQWRELEAIGLACPLEDPAARVAPTLAMRMVEEFGFSAAPAAGPATPAVTEPTPAAPRDGVRLRVRTTRFERSSRVTWKGVIEFRGPEDERLWQHECEGRAPARAAPTFAAECEAARREVAALADRCVESVAHRLRELWPRSGPRRAPAASAAESAQDRIRPLAGRRSAPAVAP